MGEVSFALPPTPLHIDGVTFPAFVAPPEYSSSSKSPLFLAGAGVRGLEIGGKFVKFTAIGIYLEESSLGALAEKWTAKPADELAASPDFYADIINGANRAPLGDAENTRDLNTRSNEVAENTGPFEKFLRVTMILPLTGEQYSDKVSENCMAHWKAIGILTEAEVDAVSKFKEVFKPETFPPGSSILFTHSTSGALSIAFSKDDSVPETNKMVIENRKLCRAVLESIIGEHGVSPAAKHSLAIRFCEHFKSQSAANQEEVHVENPVTINA